MPPNNNQNSSGSNQPAQFFQGPAQQGYPTPPPAPTTPPPSKKKNNTMLIIIIVSVAVLLLGGITVFALVAGSSKKSSKKGDSNQQKQEEKPPEKKDGEISARNLDDFREVCNGTRILNSTSYTKGTAPHPVALFISNPVEPNSYLPHNVFFNDTKWAADYKDIAKTELVGCFKRVSENEKILDCKVTSSGQQFVVPLVAVTYKMTVYEVQTAKEVGSKDIKATSGVCDNVSTFTRTNPKFYAKPTDADIVASISEFVMRDHSKTENQDTTKKPDSENTNNSNTTQN